jgi:hypothetical protein
MYFFVHFVDRMMILRCGKHNAVEKKEKLSYIFKNQSYENGSHTIANVD